MSYTCAFGNEIVQGQPKNMMQSIVRIVHYNNYKVSMKGRKLIKQFMGTSTGIETVKEVPVCNQHIEEWKNTQQAFIDSKPKYVTVEYEKYPIKQEDKQAAIKNDNVIVIDTLPNKVEEKSSWYNNDYIGFDDEPEDKYE